ILRFEKDFPNTTLIKLEQNYRSTKAILDAAHAVITKNQDRSEKKLWTSLGDGNPISILAVASERIESETIARRIKSVVDIGARRYSDFAILYRTNAQSRTHEEALMRFGVPYQIVGGQKFYDRKEIKDILAYLRLLYQPADSVSFERIVNVPTRGIGAKTLETFLSWQRESGISIQQALEEVDNVSLLSPRAKKNLFEFGALLRMLREQMDEVALPVLLDSLIRRIEYIEFINDGTVQGESRVENVKELMSVAVSYQEVGLDGFLEEISLVSDLDNAKFSSDLVTLMTVHSAKGLEFPIVFMTGMEETIFPHSRSLYDQNEMEEERRLCYVGMTRAKEELFMSYASSRMLYGGSQHNPPSRFLSDFDNSQHIGDPSFDYVQDNSNFNQNLSPSFETDEPRYIPEISEGDGIEHEVFGKGTVMEIDGENLAVYFKGRGLKKLNLSFAPIKKI
ncbi:ATP-binding domain-containing protein, partial [Candidatus Saccharibacteria bacterium]|nr:ATP-binding domain-containing protein [Candidatus Saccharibacteria bacterium]